MKLLQLTFKETIYHLIDCFQYKRIEDKELGFRVGWLRIE